MGKELSKKVKEITKAGFKIAKSYSDSKLRVDHIVLSILENDGNEVITNLKSLKLDIDKIYNEIVEFLTNNDIYPRVQTSKRLLPMTPELISVFNLIEEESNILNDDICDINHLMLAILRVQSKATSIMNKNKLTYKGYKMSLQKNQSMDENQYGDYEFQSQSDDSIKSDKKYQVLNNFSRDITKLVEEGKVDPVIGRKKEIERLAKILSRRTKSNPILIGNPGSGKSAIVEGLAQLIKEGKAPIPLLGKRIFSLDISALVAGTKYRGQFEERIKALLKEITSNKEVILFIDEIHTLVGAGGASGSMDAANILKPALARGEIQCIGATTLDEYREHIEKDGALTRRFLKLTIDEPSLEETKNILMNIKDRYEIHHNVTYTDEAIEECVNMAQRYFTERAQPDKSIDILDEAGASTRVCIEQPQEIIDLEAKKESIKKAKLLVVKNHQYEQAAKLRDEERDVDTELIGLKKDWIEKISKIKKTITPEIVAEVVSSMTGIPVSKLSKEENKRLKELNKLLTGKVIGQDDAVEKVVKAIQRNRLGIKDHNRPNSFIFLGNSGSGKTFLAKLLAEYVYGDIDAMIRIDMSEYMESFATSKLIGAPPGYIGYEKGGELTEAVRRKPYSVVLFDEIEKAHKDVFNLMLQLLDEGHLTDRNGRKVDFRNTLIIMTSNVGIKAANDFGGGVGLEVTKSSNIDKSEHIIKQSLKKTFSPEFLNRIDEIIMFKPLNEEALTKIVKLELEKLEKRLKDVKGWGIKLTSSALEFLVKNGYDDKLGARPLKRAIQKYVEDELCTLELDGEIKKGQTVLFNHTKNKDVLTTTIKD